LYLLQGHPGDNAWIILPQTLVEVDGEAKDVSNYLGSLTSPEKLTGIEGPDLVFLLQALG
jgi:hypothetical protein